MLCRSVTFALAAPAVLAAVTGGCASASERWVQSAYAGISYPSLYNVVATTIAAEGFPMTGPEAQGGQIESGWVYGTSQRVVRGPSRRRAVAEIRLLPDDRLLVRLRVVEEVVRRGGMSAVNVRASEDWEPYEDNFDDAEYLMARVAALLDEKRVASPASGAGDDAGARP